MQAILIAALSADGFIAPESDVHSPSTKWTSPEDTAWFHKITTEIGTIIMGNTTYHTIPEAHRPLKNRRNIILTRKIDTPPLFEVGPLKKGQAYYTNHSPQAILAELSKHDISQVAVCGGTSIYSQFLAQHLITKLYLTIEPLLFGKGVRLCDKPLSAKMNFVAIHHLSSQTKVIEYDIVD